jgi:hypothetical protein
MMSTVKVRAIDTLHYSTASSDPNADHVALLNPIHRDFPSQAQGQCKATSKQLPNVEKNVSSVLSHCCFVMKEKGSRDAKGALPIGRPSFRVVQFESHWLRAS